VQSGLGHRIADGAAEFQHHRLLALLHRVECARGSQQNGQHHHAQSDIDEFLHA
jgi:hypothetical protein